MNADEFIVQRSVCAGELGAPRRAADVGVCETETCLFSRWVALRNYRHTRGGRSLERTRCPACGGGYHAHVVSGKKQPMATACCNAPIVDGQPQLTPLELASLESIPRDALIHVLSLMQPFDLCRVSRVSTTLRSAFATNDLWLELLNARQAAHAHPGGTSSSFRARWCQMMDRVDDGAACGSSQQHAVEMPQMAPLATTAPVVCSSSRSASSLCGGSGSMSVGTDGEAIKRAAAQLVHRVHPYDLVDWLRTSQAQRSQLSCLVALMCLREECVGWGDGEERADGATHADSTVQDAMGGEMSRVKGGASAGTLADATEQLRLQRYKSLRAAWRLISHAPPPSLNGTLTIRWSTWSNARDCRGFRARDDLHRRTISLLTLSQELEHECWPVLLRGVGHEVRELRVSPER